MKDAAFMLTCLLLVTVCQARIITVDDDGPADFNNIQAAIDDANDGDTIIVAEGTYTGAGNRDIDFEGKAITVRSIDPNDANIVATTIIDCNGAQTEHHRGFVFHRGEQSSSVVSGLTIANGNLTAGSGGGIYCGQSSPTIKNCVITGSSAFSGGGIACLGGSPAISNCTINNNTCHSHGGGAWFRDGTRATLTNCIITGNSAEYGGGISCGGENTAQIVNCTIAGNWASSCGGGIDTRGNFSNPAIRYCILWGNTAGEGREISLRESNLTVSYSDVEGGAAAVYAEPRTKCTLVWETWNIDVDPLLIDPPLGDYHLSANSPCIDAGDPAYSPQPGETDVDGDARVMGARIDMGADESTFFAATPMIGHSAARFEWASYEGGPNPDAEILFIRNIGVGLLNWEVTPDCSWLQVYPTNGESTDDIAEVGLSADTSGLPAGLYDCELTITADGAANSPRTVKVTLYISDGKLHVPEEYPSIQAAIDAAISGDTVIIADGTYTGEGNRDIDFHGKAITVRSENGPQNCIIDCNGSEGDFHRGFYFHGGEGADSVLEGFTITNGYALNGGAIQCRYSSGPTISNCIIRGNTAARDPHPLPWLTATAGGGLYCSSSRSPTITACVFMGNRATSTGGAIFSYASQALVRNCIISGNRAELQGGGIYLLQDNMLIQNCLVSGNVTGFPGANPADEAINGAGIYGVRASPTIINCTVVGNSALAKGGAIYVIGGNPTITNCTLWHNKAREGSEIAIREGSFGPTWLSISYSDVQGGATAVYTDANSTLNWGPGNIDADPCFVAPGYWDPNGTPDDEDDDFRVGGDYHLKSQGGHWDADSEDWVHDDVTSACIDAGDTNSPVGHEPFPNGGVVNMGAYGGTAEASKSYFGGPICETIVAGDINGDCVIDFRDFLFIALHWLEDNRE